MNRLFLLIPLTLMLSCELSGVNSDTTAEDTLIKSNQGDGIVLDNNGMMLADTINGKPNAKVFQREDGLRVEWTNRTEGRKIALDDAVLINYDARVAAGEPYDSNEKIGEPVAVKLNMGMLLKGWQEGMLQMAEGDKGRIMIPNALAYGEDGYLDKVPPKADLIVDIEIVKIIEPIILEEGVKVYKYKTVQTGKTPTKNQLITFDYFAFIRGEDGHMYDNSYQNGVPFSFKFENAGVVDGLHQGMSVMKAGENAYIEIPAELAYGKKGLLDLVPKNADIVYDVRIISID